MVCRVPTTLLLELPPAHDRGLHLQQCEQGARKGREVAGEEAEGVAAGREAAGAADAVDVGLQARGEVIVDDVGQATDVQAARCYVSCHQDLHLAAPEQTHRLLRTHEAQPLHLRLDIAWTLALACANYHTSSHML